MEASELYKCLADPSRLRILSLLEQGPLCVSFAGLIGSAPSQNVQTISEHESTRLDPCRAVGHMDDLFADQSNPSTLDGTILNTCDTVKAQSECYVAIFNKEDNYWHKLKKSRTPAPPKFIPAPATHHKL